MYVTKSINAEHEDLIHDVAYDFYGKRMATCSSDHSSTAFHPGGGATAATASAMAAPSGSGSGAASSCMKRVAARRETAFGQKGDLQTPQDSGQSRSLCVLLPQMRHVPLRQ